MSSRRKGGSEVGVSESDVGEQMPMLVEEEMGEDSHWSRFRALPSALVSELCLTEVYRMTDSQRKWSDRRSMAILLLLYTLQGIPMSVKLPLQRLI